MIDDHIQKQEKAEPGDFLQTGEIKPIKPEPNVQLFDAVPGAYRQFCNGQYGGNADNCNRAKAHKQQRQAQQRIKNHAGQSYKLLKQKLLMGGNHRFQEPCRKRQGRC